MKAISSETSAVVFILAAAICGISTLQVNALSGYDRDGGRTATMSKDSKPSTVFTVSLGGEDKEIRKPQS